MVAENATIIETGLKLEVVNWLKRFICQLSTNYGFKLLICCRDITPNCVLLILNLHWHYNQLWLASKTYDHDDVTKQSLILWNDNRKANPLLKDRKRYSVKWRRFFTFKNHLSLCLAKIWKLNESHTGD